MFAWREESTKARQKGDNISPRHVKARHIYGEKAQQKMGRVVAIHLPFCVTGAEVVTRKHFGAFSLGDFLHFCPASQNYDMAQISRRIIMIMVADIF